MESCEKKDEKIRLQLTAKRSSKRPLVNAAQNVLSQADENRNITMLEKSKETDSLNDKNATSTESIATNIGSAAATLNTMSAEGRPYSTWQEAVNVLQDAVVLLAKRLDEQISVNTAQSQQIYQLQTQISNLIYESNINKHWQQSLYNELQKLNSRNDFKVKKIKPIKIVSESHAVTYGGTSHAKKLSERRRLTNNLDHTNISINSENFTSPNNITSKSIKFSKGSGTETAVNVDLEGLNIETINSERTNSSIEIDKSIEGFSVDCSVDSKNSQDMEYSSGNEIKPSMEGSSSIEILPSMEYSNENVASMECSIFNEAMSSMTSESDATMEFQNKSMSDFNHLQTETNCITQNKTSNEKHDGDGEELSIEESLRQAAQSVVSTSGFVYDETSGFYYDWTSKMYYDPTTKLYYDNQNGIYYYFDTDRNNYIFHSQVDVKQETDANIIDESYDETEEGEIISDDEDESDIEAKVDSCIRVIVVSSNLLDVGALFIITRTGGNIGRGASNSINIPENLVSKKHAQVIYEEVEKTFYIKDLCTRNGTFINNERLAEPGCPSDPYELFHKDYIKIGETTLCFHVHIGHERCEECEPGNVRAIVEKNKTRCQTFEKKEELDSQRKKQIKEMRKKYGISPGYMPNKLINSVIDRSEQRRKTLGSDLYEHGYQRVHSASIHEHISEENVGHKMLAKMGWKSGDGLGKNGAGIKQPITVDVHKKNVELGSRPKSSIDYVTVNSKKSERWNKARDRYSKLE